VGGTKTLLWAIRSHHPPTIKHMRSISGGERLEKPARHLQRSSSSSLLLSCAPAFLLDDGRTETPGSGDRLAANVNQYPDPQGSQMSTWDDGVLEEETVISGSHSGSVVCTLEACWGLLIRVAPPGPPPASQSHGLT
jgi:hypothetical protein